MRILIAPDKFKGSLTAKEVCQAVESGLRDKFPEMDCVSFPLADGGEGTMEILTDYSGGHYVHVKVHDPFLRFIDSTYGISRDGKTAFIEMSSASGLRVLTLEEKNVMKTSTLGTGEMIRDAVERGVVNIILGIGGSATNDGATGAAYALGYEFLNEKDQLFLPVGENLTGIKAIRTEKVNPALAHVKFTAVCDVENTFAGEQGAAYVYALQKGARPEQLPLLDSGLENLAEVIQRDLEVLISDVPGAGAGGGFGGGVVAFFKGTLKRGIDVVFEFTGFEEQVKKADVIITGEGKIDKQTLHGKVVAGVASLATRYNKRVIGISGVNELSPQELEEMGVEKVFALLDYADREEAFANAAGVVRKIFRDYLAECL